VVPQVIARVRRKTAMFAQDYTGDGPVEGEGRIYKVQPDRVAELFRDWVMPLTKDVEVMYLLRRLEWDR
jgi:chorismate mutase